MQSHSSHWPPGQVSTVLHLRYCNPLLPVAAERDLQRSRKTYDEVDVHVRKLLWLRALEQHGRAFADSALAVRDTFVQICLIGQQADATAGPPDMQQSAQVHGLLSPSSRFWTSRQHTCFTTHTAKGLTVLLDVHSAQAEASDVCSTCLQHVKNNRGLAGLHVMICFDVQWPVI